MTSTHFSEIRIVVIVSPNKVSRPRHGNSIRIIEKDEDMDSVPTCRLDIFSHKYTSLWNIDKTERLEKSTHQYELLPSEKDFKTFLFIDLSV